MFKCVPSLKLFAHTWVIIITAFKRNDHHVVEMDFVFLEGLLAAIRNKLIATVTEIFMFVGSVVLGIIAGSMWCVMEIGRRRFKLFIIHAMS